MRTMRILAFVIALAGRGRRAGPLLGLGYDRRRRGAFRAQIRGIGTESRVHYLGARTRPAGFQETPRPVPVLNIRMSIPSFKAHLVESDARMQQRQGARVAGRYAQMDECPRCHKRKALEPAYTVDDGGTVSNKSKWKG